MTEEEKAKGGTRERKKGKKAEKGMAGMAAEEETTGETEENKGVVTGEGQRKLVWTRRGGGR